MKTVKVNLYLKESLMQEPSVIQNSLSYMVQEH